MKNKDTQLLEEAYQSIYEAGMLSNMIDKGKAMIGMGPGKPITFEQASEQFTKALTSLGYTDIGTSAAGYLVAWFKTSGGSRCFNWVVTPEGFKIIGSVKDSGYSKLPDSSDEEFDPLTDKNLNAVIKQAKIVLASIKQQIAQEEKDAPEREKREKEFQDKQEQDRKDAFWAQRERGYLDTKSPEETYRLISKQRAASDANRNAS